MWLECRKHVENQARDLVNAIDAESADVTQKRGHEGTKFMQRAAAKQRRNARVEAEKSLREALRDQKDEMESGTEAVAAKTEVKKTKDDRAAVDRVLAKNTLQTSRVGTRKGLVVRVDGAVAIDLGDGGDKVTIDRHATNNVLELGDAVASDHEANPWLAARGRVTDVSRKKEHKSTPFCVFHE
ncbi:hypothetical protein PsorP6_006973 [Peronosclerospora sorghi]|uniref:Uncharacterized protein n=1 Tax=Peronosclerospora sorghi TaxID=230839 RepID=A0ACC0W9H8_9STRA|nr:hypothetical protein PsorP6_006973 [Peronosclerospora sorghi]